MKYCTYSSTELKTYPVCLLISQIRKDEIQRAYLDPYGLNKDHLLAIDLHYSQTKKKTPAQEMKDYITNELMPIWKDMDTEYLLVADSEYFKVLTKAPKTELYAGYVMDCVFGPWKVIYVPSFKQIFYDPDKINAKIALGINAMIAHRVGTYVDPGEHIIKFVDYPEELHEIDRWLNKLLEMNCDLTSDIEAFSLKHYDAGIGTISFAWNQGEGVAFPVDLGKHGASVRQLLKRFYYRFLATGRKMIYHNIAYDVSVLIYQLFMKDLLDTEGLLEGMKVLLTNWDDTKLITYLATNSCSRNQLSLKDQAQEFAGNYAVDNITDIRKIELPKLLEYNLVDAISTWFVLNKHWQTMVDDQQLEIYETLFKPATLDIIQMQLTGLPLDMPRVKVVKSVLEAIADNAMQRMNSNVLVQQFSYQRLEGYVEKKNNEWKVKRTTVAEIEELAKTNETVKKEITFNPNSGPQLQVLLYEIIGLPVIDVTASKQPATGGDTLKSLKNHTQDTRVKDLLDALIDFSAVDTILTNFFPAFEAAPMGPDGWHYLYGNFNLGGTVSGRLSSSGPNLQNLPANVSMLLSEGLLNQFRDVLEPYSKKGKLDLGKLIKSCFRAPPGWIFCGLDFASLEDRISALTTKDPNKLKVYTDGYDGHSLRAYAYFGDRMVGIDPTSVDSINSIAKLYPAERQDSKAPTFALTYQGTFKTLMNNCGFTIEQAQDIETKYHVLYKVSDDWVAAKLDQACKVGYVTVAFGLRVRTPMLEQVVRGTSKTPFEAEAEGRTAGNALGQSWCLLNTRAGSEFLGKVRKSEYRLMIKPCAQIHDAGYMLVRDDLGALLYTNEHLVKAVQWQDHPDIWHDTVKLGGELSIFYPDWSKECVIPNGATQEVFQKKIQEHLDKYNIPLAA